MTTSALRAAATAAGMSVGSSGINPVPADGGDLRLRQELSDCLGEGHRRVVGLHVLPAIGLEHRTHLGRHRGFRLRRRGLFQDRLRPSRCRHRWPGRASSSARVGVHVGRKAGFHIVGVRPDDRDLLDVTEAARRTPGTCLDSLFLIQGRRQAIDMHRSQRRSPAALPAKPTPLTRCQWAEHYPCVMNASAGNPKRADSRAICRTFN